MGLSGLRSRRPRGLGCREITRSRLRRQLGGNLTERTLAAVTV
jgi:hypothetical protein